MMQKSQFSGRLGAMRRDTPRCCAIIITTDDIIPSPDLPLGADTLLPTVETDFTDRPAGSDALLMGTPDHPWKMDDLKNRVIPISSSRSILRAIFLPLFFFPVHDSITEADRGSRFSVMGDYCLFLFVPKMHRLTASLDFVCSQASRTGIKGR